MSRYTCLLRWHCKSPSMPPNIHCRASSSVRSADSLSYLPGLHAQAHVQEADSSTEPRPSITIIYRQLPTIHQTDLTLTPDFWGEANLKGDGDVVCTACVDVVYEYVAMHVACVSYVVDFVLALWSNHHCLQESCSGYKTCTQPWLLYWYHSS